MRRTKRNRQLMFHRPQPIRSNLGIATTIPPEDFEYDYDWGSYFNGSVRVPHKRGSGSDRLRVNIDIGAGTEDEEGTFETEWYEIDAMLLYDEYDNFEFNSESELDGIVGDFWRDLDRSGLYEADLERVENYRRTPLDGWGSRYLYVMNFFTEDDAEYFQEGEDYNARDLFEDHYIDEMEIFGQEVQTSIPPDGTPEYPECEDGNEGFTNPDDIAAKGYMLLSELDFRVVEVEGQSVYFIYTGAGGYPVIDEIEIYCTRYDSLVGGSGWSITFNVNDKMSSGEGDNEFAIIAAVEHILAEAMELANDDDQLPYRIEFTAIGQRGGGRDKVYKIFARKIAREWDYDIVSDDVSFKLTKKEI